LYSRPPYQTPFSCTGRSFPCRPGFFIPAPTRLLHFFVRTGHLLKGASFPPRVTAPLSRQAWASELPVFVSPTMLSLCTLRVIASFLPLFFRVAALACSHRFLPARQYLGSAYSRPASCPWGQPTASISRTFVFVSFRHAFFPPALSTRYRVFWFLPTILERHTRRPLGPDPLEENRA